jgi:hypothetical protein
VRAEISGLQHDNAKRLVDRQLGLDERGKLARQKRDILLR